MKVQSLIPLKQIHDETFTMKVIWLSPLFGALSLVTSGVIIYQKNVTLWFWFLPTMECDVEYVDNLTESVLST